MPKYLEGAAALHRNAPVESFRASFPTAAGTVGAPRLDLSFRYNDGEPVEDLVTRFIDDAQVAYDKGGMVLVLSPFVTDGAVIDVLQTLDTAVLTQKEYFKVPTLNEYVHFRTFFRRNDLPGGILDHLVRGDGQDDHGIIDGCRIIGNYYSTVLKRVNEIRPLMHMKLIVILWPDKKGGKLVPQVAYVGSANLSRQSRSSFELSTRYVDRKTLDGLFGIWSFMFSLSEGLFNMSNGLQPTYRWKDKVQVYSQVPACSDCGSKMMAPMWMKIPEEHGNDIVRYLICNKCGERHPFIEEGKEVIQ